jgi:hypothetical protein
MAVTNKQLLISESTVIQIDVHHARENPTNTTRTLLMPVHVRPAYASCGRSPYVATFHESSTGLDGCTAPEKKCSQLHLPARLSGPWDPPQFFSQHIHWSSALKPSTYRRQTTRLIGLISLHVISTFNTCSRVPTPQSLADTGGGYHIENLRIATALSPPFPSEGSSDPPNGPTRSQVIQQHLPKELERGTSPKSREWEPPLDFYRILPSTHSMS